MTTLIARIFACLCLTSFGCAAAATATAAEPVQLPLWPAEKLTKLPQAEIIVERSKVADKKDRSVRFVSEPTVTVYLPEKKDGAVGGATPAIVICPGGGYGGLAIDKEGHDVARWLNRIGVAGIVLKYRLPRVELSQGKTPWPIEDARRAIRLVRSRSADWKIDPSRVGIMGFSAGGHLAAMTGTHFDLADGSASDPVDHFSTRPDFMVLVYPVISMREPIVNRGSRTNLLGKMPDTKQCEFYSADLQVSSKTPPAFVVQAKDDPIKVENSLMFGAAMQKMRVPCRMEIYEKGGHGFGLGVHGGDVASWPTRCEEWLRERKMLQ
jgi:acetyl esterase/lipase